MNAKTQRKPLKIEPKKILNACKSNKRWIKLDLDVARNELKAAKNAEKQLLKGKNVRPKRYLGYASFGLAGLGFNVVEKLNLRPTTNLILNSALAVLTFLSLEKIKATQLSLNVTSTLKNSNLRTVQKIKERKKRDVKKLTEDLNEVKEIIKRKNPSKLPRYFTPKIKKSTAFGTPVTLVGLTHSYERNYAKHTTPFSELERHTLANASPGIIVLEGARPTTTKRKPKDLRAIDAKSDLTNALSLKMREILSIKKSKPFSEIKKDLPRIGYNSDHFRDLIMASNIRNIARKYKKPVIFRGHHSHAENLKFYLDNPTIFKRHLALISKATKGEYAGVSWKNAAYGAW